MSDDFIGKRFGRYLLLDHLIDGGMAKICRARFLGDDIARVVAIKMVHPKYTQDPAFKTMFMDEIKVSFGLMHPNIVQIYDYGENDNQLFVALEYCDGKNLKEFLDKLKAKKYVFPVEISIHITTQICQGLFHAHTYVDKLTGKKANIVHRDISPHNIMLTYDGSIKVIDFGIAKAETNSEATQAGTIKGKLSYLAPEYLEGLELDHRYDQFAVGITLWELLCNRKLFRAKNDLAVLKKIQECKIPVPSSINPNVPKELDEIVLKALSKNRDHRYKNMDGLNRALIKFLYANYPDFNASDLSYFAKDLFKEEIITDREKLFEFGKIDVTEHVKAWTNEQSSAKKIENIKKNREDFKSNKTREFEFDFDDDNLTQTRNQNLNKKLNNNKTDRRYDLEIESNIKTNADIKVGQTIKKKTANTVRKKKSLNRKRENITSTKTSVTELQARKKSKFPFVAALLIIGGGFFAKGHIQNFLNKGDTVINSVVENKVIENDQRKRNVASKQEQKVDISLDNFNSFNQKLFVNGKTVKPNYLNNISLSKNKDYTLRVEQNGYFSHIQKIKNLSHEMTIKVPKLVKGKFAHVFMSNNCMEGKVFYELNGEKREVSLPLNKKNNLTFPMKSLGRNTASDELPVYNLYIQEKDSIVQKKVELSIVSEKFSYDLCEII